MLPAVTAYLISRLIHKWRASSELFRILFVVPLLAMEFLTNASSRLSRGGNLPDDGGHRKRDLGVISHVSGVCRSTSAIPRRGPLCLCSRPSQGQQETSASPQNLRPRSAELTT